MKNLALVVFFIALCNSCTSNSQTKGYENFKSEISKSAIIKIDKNMPFPVSKNDVADYKYHSYYETFGHSSIRVQYKLAKKKQEEFLKKMEKYILLDNNLLKSKDSDYVYKYDSKNINIEMPGFDDEFEELKSFNLENDKEVKVYLIENGEIQDFYVNGDKKKYNFSSGVYFFKENNIILYWFLVY